MQHKHHFKHIDVSESLQNYVEDLIAKNSRYLLKDAVCNFYYSKSKHHHQCQVEINVQNGTGYFKATSEAESFYLAADKAADKLSKQFKKTKDKLQHHKDFSSSREGRLERINDRMEHEPIILPHKKTA